ncbi:23851_t:CDS:2 [Gigaspora rosea]|nr:23851_t:CDS:2 [Gigaspora rosea]
MTKTNIPNIEISHKLNITQTYLVVLHNALPQDYYYIIDSFEALKPYDFLGAYSEPFKVEFHVNASSIESVRTWLDKPPKEKKNNMHETESQEKPSRFIMPAQLKRTSKKRPHDLNQALKEIRPNGLTNINYINLTNISFTNINYISLTNINYISLTNINYISLTNINYVSLTNINYISLTNINYISLTNINYISLMDITYISLTNINYISLTNINYI